MVMILFKIFFILKNIKIIFFKILLTVKLTINMECQRVQVICTKSNKLVLLHFILPL